jgi:hypothetical protein
MVAFGRWRELGDYLLSETAGMTAVEVLTEIGATQQLELSIPSGSWAIWERASHYRTGKIDAERVFA